MAKHSVKFIYGITLTVSVLFFSFYLFPAGKIQEYIMVTFIRSLPDYQLMIGETQPAFPVAMKLSDVKILKMNEAFIETAELKVGVPVLSLFSPGKTFSIKSRAYDGVVTGTVRIGDADAGESNTGESVNGKFRLNDIQIEKIEALQRELKEKISGTLQGDITFDVGNPETLADFNLKLAEATMPLAISFLRLGNITFSEINIEGSLKNENLAIGTCVFGGRQMSGQISGEITLKEPVGKSLLNLTGTVKPEHDLMKNLPRNMIPANLMKKDGIPFGISGTVDKPGLSFR
jgi:type II secretion system protein N